MHRTQESRQRSVELPRHVRQRPDVLPARQDHPPRRARHDRIGARRISAASTRASRRRTRFRPAIRSPMSAQHPNDCAEIFNWGFRNPFRFSIDRETGDMLIGDVGQNTYEEIDFQPAGSAGQNFQWNQCEGFHTYPGGGAPCTGPTGQRAAEARVLASISAAQSSAAFAIAVRSRRSAASTSSATTAAAASTSSRMRTAACRRGRPRRCSGTPGMSTYSFGEDEAGNLLCRRRQRARLCVSFRQRQRCHLRRTDSTECPQKIRPMKSAARWAALSQLRCRVRAFAELSRGRRCGRFVRFCCGMFGFAAAAAIAQTVPPDLSLELVTSAVTAPIGVRAPHDGSGRLFVISQAGTIRVIENGHAAADAVPDRVRDVSRARAARAACSASRSIRTTAMPACRTTTSSTSSTCAPAIARRRAAASAAGPTKCSNATRCRRIRTSPIRPARSSCDSPTTRRRRSTTAATSISVRTAISIFRSATADRKAARTGSPNVCGRSRTTRHRRAATTATATPQYFLRGKMLRIDVDNARRNRGRGNVRHRDRRAGGVFDPGRQPVRRARRTRAMRSISGAFAIRGAGASIAKPATCGSATSARITGKRSTCARKGSSDPIYYGWHCMEGTSVFNSSQVCTPPLQPNVLPLMEYDHATGSRCAVTGGYRYRGPITDSAACTCSPIRARARSSSPSPMSSNVWTFTTWRNDPNGYGTYSGFGEDEAGNLYVADTRARQGLPFPLRRGDRDARRHAGRRRARLDRADTPQTVDDGDDDRVHADARCELPDRRCHRMRRHAGRQVFTTAPVTADCEVDATFVVDPSDVIFRNGFDR